MKKKTYILAVAITAMLAAGAANALPADTMHDLTVAGTDTVSFVGHSTTNEEAIFSTDFTQPAGTGVIDPFIRTQILGGSGGEQGYNTDGQEEFQTKDAGGSNWDHSLLLADVPIVTVNGIKYREFMLDVNESQGDAKYLLSLDELQFFTTSDPAITGYDDTNNNFGSNADLAWEMDTNKNDNWIKLDNCKADGTCGSGDFDMKALIPDKAFANKKGQYVVLFNRFGDHFAAEAGFEEWIAPPGKGGNGGSVPEPITLALFGLGLFGMAYMRRQQITSGDRLSF
jgi:hypothetical protein